MNDREADLLALEAALAPLGLPVVKAGSATEGLRVLQQQPVALAIVDVQMPEMDGIEMVRTIRHSRDQHALPVIVVSAHEVSGGTLRQIYEFGAADFIALPAEPEVLRGRVSLLLDLRRQARRAEVRARNIQHAADIAVSAQEERFQLLADAASDYALFFIDTHGVISDWTVAAEHLFGYSAREAVGQAAALIFTPEDRARGAPAEELTGAARTGQARDNRLHVRKDGSRFPTTGRMIALRRPSGELTGFAKIVRDATTLRELQESERKFRQIFESAHEGIWLLDAEGRIEMVNARMAEMLGYEASAMLGRHKVDFAFPEDRGAIGQLFEGRKQGNAMTTEVRFRDSHGRAVWTLMSGRPRFQNGAFAGALDMFTDITARRSAETELAESRTRLRLAIEAADLGVFFRDGRTGRDTWNENTKQMLGIPNETRESLEVLFTRVHPDDMPRIEALAARLLDPRNPAEEFGVDFRVVWPDGSVRHLSAHGVTTPPGPEQVSVQVVGTVRDVTAMKDLEQELRRKVAERTRDLEEKTRQLESFSYTVAHDLRAPLRSINGYAEMLIDEIATANGQTKLDILERIKAATRRLDMLIGDLMAYSRVAQVDVTLERVELEDAVRRARHDLQAEIERREAVVRVPVRLPAVQGERTIVEQAILNLLSNAVKFARPGEKPVVDVWAEEHGERVVLKVRDQGIGIPARYQQQIFKVFERLQASRDYPGTGVGLAIVAKGMERIGGRYGVESEPGRGSTFWIELSKAEG